jgi:hypothetical protein
MLDSLLARTASQISAFGFAKEFKSYLPDYTCFGEARCTPTIPQVGTQKNCIKRKQKWLIKCFKQLWKIW